MVRPSIDTEKFCRVSTTKYFSQKRSDVTTIFAKSDIIMAPKLAMDTDIVNINQETLFSKLGFPYVIPM